MRKFRLGQRVKILPCEARPALHHLFGETATIIGFYPASALPPGWIDLNYYVLDLLGENGVSTKAAERVLVPLYDGDEPASWETCAWRPKELSNAPS